MACIRHGWQPTWRLFDSRNPAASTVSRSRLNAGSGSSVQSLRAQQTAGVHPSTPAVPAIAGAVRRCDGAGLRIEAPP
jgi:hypothetical protein